MNEVREWIEGADPDTALRIAAALDALDALAASSRWYFDPAEYRSCDQSSGPGLLCAGSDSYDRNGSILSSARCDGVPR